VATPTPARPASSGPGDDDFWPPADWLRTDDDGSVALLGGYSPSSGQFHFPLGPLCPYTGADDVEPVALSPSGTLFAWTAVTAPPPGYQGDVPFGFGIVELSGAEMGDARLRVIGRLTEADPDALTFGQPMRVVVDTLPGDHPMWAFAPAAPATAAPPEGP
jgi:uncharacterized protein